MCTKMIPANTYVLWCGDDKYYGQLYFYTGDIPVSKRGEQFLSDQDDATYTSSKKNGKDLYCTHIKACTYSPCLCVCMHAFMYICIYKAKLSSICVLCQPDRRRLHRTS